MSRFNYTSHGTKTVNIAGGQAYSQTAELELVSILLTSFTQNQFYRSADDTFERLKEVINSCDKEFVAKAAIYARTQFGMRSISHVCASELAKHISGRVWAKSFYNAIIYRPDDMTEIISYHKGVNGKTPNAMKKGFAKAFGKFDKYSLAKYRGEGKGVKLVDVVNLVHPTASEKNGNAIELLVKGELKSFNTWESELAKAGQNSETEQEKNENKKQVWIKLVEERKIGYFALLRNLRNIIEQAPEILPQAIDMLIDRKLIKRSLVLPFRFITAFDELQKLSGKNAREILMALNTAVDISLDNIPNLEGDTLVVLDVSGSMRGNPAKIGSLFASVLVKNLNADCILFSNNAKYVNVNPLDSTITIASKFRFAAGGTKFNSIFETADRKYDRIIILSDMQGWGHHSLSNIYNKWKLRTNSNPFVYSFDLNSYGSMQFPEKNVFCLSGFSDKIFDVMKLLEKDKNALINKIKEIKF